MRRPTRATRRLLLVPALLLCLMLAASVPAAAYSPPNDYQTGSVGDYDFRDYASGSHQGNVECHYHVFSSGQRRLEEFVLRAPRIWWPDQDSATTHEHGTVGWQYRIQESSAPDTVPFSTVYSSSVQKHTAHEDHPGYSDGDKAPFTTRTHTWSSGQSEYYRIKYTITWYFGHGVTGTVSHWYNVYDSSDTVNPVDGFCANKYTGL